MSAVGASLYAPLASEEADRTRFRVVGEAMEEEQAPRALLQIVSRGYFAALDTRVVTGRPFDRRDRLETLPVAVINRELQRRIFADRDPVGQRLDSELVIIPDGPSERVIVGVVEDQAQLGPLAAREPTIYVPHSQVPWGSMELLVRSDLAAETLLPSLRGAILELDEEVILDPPVTLSGAFDEALVRPRSMAVLLLGFALSATLLAAVGLYASLAIQVAQRAGEIGLRMALGATRGRVARHFLLKGALLTAGGLVPGLLLAAVLSRLVASQLHGIGPNDPVALGMTLVVLVLVGLVASWLPARRASRFDPQESLRQEAG